MGETNKAERILRDAKMRRVLFELLWETTQGQPMLLLNDEGTQQELRRIILGETKRRDFDVEAVVIALIMGLVVGLVFGIMIGAGL